MDLRTFFASERGTGLGIWVGRHMPPRVGLLLVRLTSAYIVKRRNSSLVRGIRVNQSVARDLPLDSPELDQAVLQVLRHAGRGYYELYRRLGKGREAMLEAIAFPPELDTHLENAQARGQGTMIVGPHMGNFDLALLAFGVRGLPIQAITFAVPPGGYALQNRIRADAGYTITPADGPAVKMALRRLRAGGIVATGLDRPMPGETRTVQFFGRPAPLPTGYVRLALSAGAQLLVIWVETTEEGAYRARVTPPIQLVQTGNRRYDTVSNTERVLARAAEVIRARPEEWMMFSPVWPQLLED